MSRSIKKGPFCAPELLKRVDELNKKGVVLQFDHSGLARLVPLEVDDAVLALVAAAAVAHSEPRRARRPSA